MNEERHPDYWHGFPDPSMEDDSGPLVFVLLVGVLVAVVGAVIYFAFQCHCPCR